MKNKTKLHGGFLSWDFQIFKLSISLIVNERIEGKSLYSFESKGCGNIWIITWKQHYESTYYLKQKFQLFCSDINTSDEWVIYVSTFIVVLSRLVMSDSADHSPPGSSVHGISQARILDWDVILFSNIYCSTIWKTQ